MHFCIVPDFLSVTAAVDAWHSVNETATETTQNQTVTMHGCRLVIANIYLYR